MAGHRVTLRIEPSVPGSKNVRLTDFLQQLEALRTSLRRTESLVTGQETLDWEIVALSHSSPATVVLEPILPPEDEPDEERKGKRKRKRKRPDPRAKVVNRFFDYMQSLTYRASAPPEMDRETLRAFQDLTAPVRHDRVRATISNGSKSVEIVGAVDATVNQLLAPRFRETGAVEGRLEYLNIHGGKYRFRIWPEVGPARVQCIFPKSKLSDARNAVGFNVRVSGELVFRERDEFPFRVHVEDIERLPEDDELPKMSDLLGAVSAKYLKGMSSEDFIAAVRADGDW